uniref:Palmitoyltransferase n=1 Tax=Albugo laibachii Nc14 TaxID=890382 RepID=F0WFN1_9STRA|nr:palmitoyltransferase putative [Albugo laibachii Nc14]CCA23269.1 palmitoyltransferase putative [Albugo laibachii Nc14]|eukprot:CCA23269.1 palmitoyltransferase putative [Albugo laibachii Nc14]
MRKNGWQTPHHGLQVATWIVFPILIVAFFLLCSPLLDKYVRFIVTVSYGIAATIVIAAVWRCTSCDPSDTNAISSLHPVGNVQIDQNRIFCNVCMQYVHRQSRHCRLCNKCVEVFDHHCKWLNNCIGSKNYRFFLTSVIFTSTLLSIQLATGCYVFYQTFSDPDLIRARAASFFGCMQDGQDAVTGLCHSHGYRLPLIVIKILHGLLLVWLLPSWLMILQLTLFHFQLCVEHITTYDYIVRKRKRKLAQERENLPPVPWWRFMAPCLFKKPLSSPTVEFSEKNDLRKASDLYLENELEEEIEVEVENEMDISSSGRGSRRQRVYSAVAATAADIPAFTRSLPPPVPPRNHSWFERAKSGRYSLQDTFLVDVPPSLSEESVMNYVAAPGTPLSPESKQSVPKSNSEPSIKLPEPLRASVVYI